MGLSWDIYSGETFNMAKSKQHKRRKSINPTHIMKHNRKVHNGVYEEDTFIERLALFCILIMMLPILLITILVMWIWDKVTGIDLTTK